MASQGDIPPYFQIGASMNIFVKACTTGTFKDLGTYLIQYMLL